MKARGAFLFILWAAVQACAPAAFISADAAAQGSDDASGETGPPIQSEPIPEPPTAPEPGPIAKVILEVSTPSPEIKAGKEKMQAKAVIKDGDPNPKVTWTVKGPADLDPGSIDERGLYTSPEKIKDPFEVEITATLVDDPTVSDTVKVRIIPAEEIFVRCTRGSEIVPIVADVYAIPVDSNRLPDFDSLTKITTVCLDRYAVAKRRFENGFPDVPSLFEYFALKTSTTLIVPEDGSYTFRLNSDDGSKLFIDNRLVIDNDGLHGATAKEATITLSKGEHALNLDYFQGPRVFIALELFWKIPGSNAFEIIPRESFR